MATILPKYIVVLYFFKRSCKQNSTDDPEI